MDRAERIREGARRVEARLESFRRDVRSVLNDWSREKLGSGPRPEHEEIARRIVDRLAPSLSRPIGHQGILLEVDEETGLYKSVRLAEWEGPEETLYPIDPETDEPVPEAVADIALPLVDPFCVPEI